MEVISIEEIGIEEIVYDLETESGTFVAGGLEHGILVKNTDSCYVKFPIHKSDYENDEELEQQLHAGFPHQETPDQLQAMEDIKKDLALQKPMDRIVCGDVGFGKTEIAIRAAFLAAANSRQCAVICPTTILASRTTLR